MMRIIPLAAATCAVLLMGTAGFPHRPYPIDDERAVREAHAIVIATLRSSSEKNERCATTTVDRLRVESVIRGEVAVGTELSFVRSIFHWRRARWPWEKDCPSVHYFVPPRVERASQGDRVIATLARDRPDGPLRVTGTIDISRHDAVRRLVR
ncbi:MAG TPA: hypothetical protein PKM65_08565 [Spirochaetota bacterium]|nr:hypothetical protein [Spirochaetota bacterium]HNT12519.1 hypothetical protein [Spirochaetota bacterium]